MSKSDSSFGADILSAAVGSAFDFLGNAGMAAINNNMSQSQAKYAMNLQKRYNKWFIPFSLEQQNKYNLEYQSAYHTTRPKWDVSGLRAAGLNPVLAASGGFGSGSAGTLSASGQSVSPPTSFGGKFNSRFDPLTLKNMELLDAQIEGQLIKNNNDLQNRGLSGQYGALSRLISESGISKDDPSTQHRPKDFTKVLDSVGEFLGRRLGNDGKTAAESYVTTSPRTLEQFAIKRATEDTPPSMREHQKYIEHDGFNLRDWHRSSRKIDGKYKYRRREPWEHIYRW